MKTVHPREPIDELMLAALRDLRDAGEGEPFVTFRHGVSVAYRLAAAGLATIDDGPAAEAMIRLTIDGRLLLLDS